MRRTRSAAVIMLLLLALAAVPSCTETTDCGADGTGAITFATVKNLSAAQRRELTDRWDAGHSEPLDIVVLPATSDQQRTQLAATLQADKRAGRALPDGYDVVGLDTVNLPEFAKGGYLQPLDTQRFAHAGFLSVPWRSSFYAHELYAVPFTTNAGLLYYWADKLVSLGEIADEDEPWNPNWRDVAKVALESLKDPAQNDKRGYTGQFKQYEGLTANTMELIWAQGGDLPTPTHQVSAAELDGAADGVSFLLDGVRQGWITGPSLDYDEAASLNAFLAKKALIMRHWPDAWPTLSTASPDIRVTMLPGNRSTTLGGESLAVARCSPNRRTAEDFLAFLTAGEQQQWIFQAGVYLPTVAGLYTDGSLEGGTLKLQPSFIALLKASIDNARPRPVLPAYSDASQLIQTRIHQALQAAPGEPPDPRAVVDDLADDLRG